MILNLAQTVIEEGMDAGQGLSATETFAYFIAAPTILFLVITGISFAMTAPRKNSGKSVITHIE